MSANVPAPAEVVHSFSTDLNPAATTHPSDTEGYAPTNKNTKVNRNYYVEPSEDPKKVIYIGLPFPEIALELRIATGDWPRRVGSKMFGINADGSIRWLEGASELVAWLGSKNINVDWRSNSKASYIQLPTKAEIFCYLSEDVKKYDAIYHLPHYPRFEGSYYTPEADRYKPKKTGLFSDFVNLFEPYSEEDRILIAAFFATTFWNCEPGSRPLFVIEGPPDDPEGGVGVGKSILVEAAAALSSLEGGGYIDGPDDKFNPDEIKRRILNDSSDSRIVRFDNIKKMSMSSPVLESMITTGTISGHGMHKGHKTKPNRFTYVMTFNEASLSKDLASRAVRIRLNRPVDNLPAWKTELFKLIRTRRVELVSDLLCFLAQPGDKFETKFRFQEWFHEVLCKFSNGKDLGVHLDTGRAELNNETSILEEIESAIANRLRSYFFMAADGHANYFNPDTQNILIPNSLLISWLKKDLGHYYDSSHKIKKAVRSSKLLRDGRICRDKLTHRGLLWMPTGQPQGFFPSAIEREVRLPDHKVYTVTLVRPGDSG